MAQAASKGSPHRQVDKPVTERVIKGPQEGMVEDLDTNLALVRKHLRTARLRVQEVEVGTLSRTRCAVLHVDGVTNPRLVKEVLRRRGRKASDVAGLVRLDLPDQLVQGNLAAKTSLVYFFPFRTRGRKRSIPALS